MTNLIDRGMDLGEPDRTSDDEIEAFRASYERSHGKQLAAYNFWLRFSPSVVKRHRLQARWTPDDAGRAYALPGTLGFLYLYTILAYHEGIDYETKHARQLGASDAAILQTFELAFIRSGPRGMDAAWTAARPHLETAGSASDDPEGAYPLGWAARPETFDLGFAPDVATLTAEETERIRVWYLEFAGEVPPFVEFLAEARPGLLKAYWLRLGAAMRGPLPAEMFAFLELQAAVGTAQGSAVGLAVGLARGLGLTREQAVEAIGWGMMYGGPEAVGMAAAAVETRYGQERSGVKERK